MDKYLLILIVLLLFWMISMCKKPNHYGSSPMSLPKRIMSTPMAHIKSSFSSVKSFFNESLKITPNDAKTDSIADDTVLIFFAPWCGHCKKSMGEFKEAATQGSGKIMLISSEDPESKNLMQKYSVGGFPTIVKGTGEKYNGSRDARSIVKFASN